jgi:hypothetical protein
VSHHAETLDEIRARTAPLMAFDGVYRPQAWLAVDQWQAVAYISDGRFGTRLVFEDKMHSTEAEAQEACDRANAAGGAHSGAAQRGNTRQSATKATRTGVSTPSEAPKQPDLLF